LAAGQAALADEAFIELARRHNDYWRGWLANELNRLGIDVAPSVANFILARFPAERDAASADAFLRERGIILRAMGTYGLANSLRITIGRDDELVALRDALTDFMGV
jgi:histidinol-phosphate aminotransferase